MYMPRRKNSYEFSAASDVTSNRDTDCRSFVNNFLAHFAYYTRAWRNVRSRNRAIRRQRVDFPPVKTKTDLTKSGCPRESRTFPVFKRPRLVAGELSPVALARARREASRAPLSLDRNRSTPVCCACYFNFDLCVEYRRVRGCWFRYGRIGNARQRDRCVKIS